MSSLIHVRLNTHPYRTTPTQKQFTRWVQAALSAVNIRAKEIHIHIVSEKESARLNKFYRKKTGPTNILSFHYNTLPGIPNDSLGDLIICNNLVKKEARAQQKKLIAHWAHLTIHGVLHLLGYDHVQLRDAKKMEALEIVIMGRVGYANPYLGL